VLHVFHKKSKHGIAAPKSELDLIRQRLKTAVHRQGWIDITDITRGSGNVFAHVGLPDPETHQLRG
jgi:hypothetical protein